MAVLSKRLIVPALLTNASVLKYTAPVNNITKDIEFMFCNTDATNTIGVTLNLVENGGTAGASNTFLLGTGASAFLLGPGESRSWSTEQVLLAGDAVYALATTTLKVSMFMSGREISQG